MPNTSSELSTVIGIRDIVVRLTARENEIANECVLAYIEGMAAQHKHYSKTRNAYDPKGNSASGKKGEVFAAKCLHDMFGFPKECKPDFNIYAIKDKSWKADLPFNEFDDIYPPAHVKTSNQWSYNYVGDYSYLFAHTGGMSGTDDIFSLAITAKDLLVLVYLDPWQGDTATIKAILPWRQLFYLEAFRAPENPKYHGLKLALNLEALKQCYPHLVKDNIYN